MKLILLLLYYKLWQYCCLTLMPIKVNWITPEASPAPLRGGHYSLTWLLATHWFFVLSGKENAVFFCRRSGDHISALSWLCVCLATCRPAARPWSSSWNTSGCWSQTRWRPRPLSESTSRERSGESGSGVAGGSHSCRHVWLANTYW